MGVWLRLVVVVALVCGGAARASAQVDVSTQVTSVVGTRWTDVREAAQDQAERLGRCMPSRVTTTVVGTLRVGVDASGRAVGAALETTSIGARTARCIRRRALAWRMPARGVVYVVTARVELSVVASPPLPEVRVTVDGAPLRRAAVAPPLAPTFPGPTFEATVSGTRAPRRWLAVLDASRPSLAGCASTPGASAVISIDVDRAGRVRAAAVTQSERLYFEQIRCIEAKLRGLHFPRSPRGVTIARPIAY